MLYSDEHGLQCLVANDNVVVVHHSAMDNMVLLHLDGDHHAGLLHHYQHCIHKHYRPDHAPTEDCQHTLPYTAAINSNFT